MSNTNPMPTVSMPEAVDPTQLNVNQFNSDPLNNRVTIVMSDMQGGSIAIYAPPADGVRGGIKDQIKASCIAYMERATAAIEAL